MKRLLLLFLSSTLLYTLTNARGACNKAEKMVVKEKPCRCYCSDVCGPRDATKPGDKPFYDKEYNKCFCQQRDKDNYLKNKCDLKKQTEPTTCCPKQKTAGCCTKKK